LHDDLDLDGLLALLGCADGFVGNDAGGTHLAAALGVPTVCVAFATDPARTAPRGERVVVLDGAPERDRRRRALAIAPAEVGAALQGLRRQGVTGPGVG
jgi:ADP-heptose:LPS heptosyltransferase